MMTWIAENWVVVLMMWIVGGFVLALIFGKAATLGKTQREQELEDEAQAAWLDEYFKNNQ